MEYSLFETQVKESLNGGVVEGVKYPKNGGSENTDDGLELDVQDICYHCDDAYVDTLEGEGTQEVSNKKRIKPPEDMCHKMLCCCTR